MRSLSLVASLVGLAALSAPAGQAATTTTYNQTKTVTTESAYAGDPAISAWNEPAWDQSYAWRRAVPGASPRPGASLTGPASITGVVSLAQLDDVVTSEDYWRTNRTDLPESVDANGDGIVDAVPAGDPADPNYGVR